MIVALAGGVGAARMLRGLVAVVDPASITAVVNTGDDTVLHGLHISPDLDTVTYTLAGVINPETGWGLAGETWAAMDELRAYSGGRLGWFNLGDRDLGTHLYRTSRLAEGATLTEVTAEIAGPLGRRRSGSCPCPTTGSRPGWWSSSRTGPATRSASRSTSSAAATRCRSGPSGLPASRRPRPAPGVLDAIAGADCVVICPSNPIVSIGPVLATGGIGAAVAARRDRVVAVSPIVAGNALKGPADRMLAELGHEASVVGVARLWSPFAATLVIDEADAGLAEAVEAAGMRPVVAPTVMTGPAEAAALARTVLDAARPTRAG